MTVRIVMQGKPVAVQWKESTGRNLSLIARASTGGARAAGLQIKKLGDQDIQQAGKFSRRWKESLTVEVIPKTGFLINAIINVFHKIPYANVFETGATIRGKPMLWIPLSFTGIKIRARDYARRFGGLITVRRTGKAPLLFSIRDHEPKYLGISSVRLKKRFHLRKICADVMKDFAKYYSANLKG